MRRVDRIERREVWRRCGEDRRQRGGGGAATTEWNVNATARQFSACIFWQSLLRDVAIGDHADDEE
jgi:hypothetical protein